MADQFAECPLKPAPEPSRLVAPLPGERRAAGACTGTKCAWFITQRDEQGNIVAGSCAMAVTVQLLANLNAQLAQFTVRAVPAETPAVPN